MNLFLHVQRVVVWICMCVCVCVCILQSGVDPEWLELARFEVLKCSHWLPSGRAAQAPFKPLFVFTRCPHPPIIVVTQFIKTMAMNMWMNMRDQN